MPVAPETKDMGIKYRETRDATGAKLWTATIEGCPVGTIRGCWGSYTLRVPMTRSASFGSLSEAKAELANRVGVTL